MGSLRLSSMNSTNRGRRFVRARFDSAQTTLENKRHWINADHLSPNAALLPSVRKLVRSRARYEHMNNSYAYGIVESMSDYVVGTGARLQMTSEDTGLNGLIESKFREWTNLVGLNAKTQTLHKTHIVSGEGFAVLVQNPKLQTESQLDVRLIETDQVSNPLFDNRLLNPQMLDGITVDKHDNVLNYRVLRDHPGELMRLEHNAFDDIPAKSMLHIFDAVRPGQKRGLSLLSPALPLFAQLRRYTLAVLGAAESAALPAGVITSDAPADGEGSVAEPLDEVEMDRGTWLQLPGGWDVKQFKAEHPTSTYKEFKLEILNEIARVLGMPFNLAAGNSSDYNYASGRLDHQSFARKVLVRQKQLVEKFMDPIFAAWLSEMVLIAGALPRKARLAALTSHQWFFDGVEHVDPKKEAEAQDVRLRNHTTTLAVEYARQGRDWKEEITQRGKEVALLKSLNLSPEEARPVVQETRDED